MVGKRICYVVATMLASAACGCGSVEQQLLRWTPPDPIDEQDAVLRMEYQESGSPESIRGLLAHYVKQGMSPGEVSDVIGEPGHIVRDDGWIKNDGGTYQIGDETYKWGPDERGNSYFLVFRDHKLVNFNPAEFR